MAQVQYPAGTAPIKPEYIISLNQVCTVDDDAAEGGSSGTSRRDQPQPQADGRPGPTNGTDETGPKRSGRLTKEQKKAQRGANKGRRFGKVKDEFDLCWKVANGASCEFGSECRFSHDIGEYLAAKPADLHFPPKELLSTAPPYAPDMQTLRKPHEKYPNIDVSTSCPVMNETGDCRYGFKCRFLGAHVHESSEEEQSRTGLPLSITRDAEKQAQAALTAHEINFVGVDVQRKLQSKKYQTPIADAYLAEVGEQPFHKKREQKQNRSGQQKSSIVIGEDGTVVVGEPEQEPDFGDASEEKKDEVPMDVDTRAEENGADALVAKRTADAVPSEAHADTPDIPMRSSEKKRLHWTGKTYLAPLTTVGNLPFRRICVDFGADITCGEMGLANSFLSGSKEEWSLVRRHPSEKIFGVQVAGNKVNNLVPTAEVLAKELGSSGIDFVDLNCGCPIDLVFKSGSGSALLDTVGRLGKIVAGMNRALGEIPVTVKLRTGVKDGKNTAHKTMPRLAAEWGAAALTLHGRTRQQRYTKLADWDYIKESVEAVRAREKDEDLAPVPIFGGGDCFSSEDYYEKMERSGVDGIMIGRGALIKPWIFTEIKERREWDISASERLDIVRKYAEYGLNHFGSDTTGVNATRRYLCEALSFQYRYVPIGLLEILPGRINDRAPAFRGRSELETLLASPDSQDWVKISEMFLGPAPETWSFTPKHKSNAYGSEEGQG